MLAKKSDENQLTFNTLIEEQIDHKHPLYALAKKINWEKFEKTFSGFYSKDMGTPAKPIRMMVGLLILKHIRDLSDESVVEQWSENLYYQYFCGEKIFKSAQPCAGSELTHFRERIGEAGFELILQESILVQAEIKNKRDKDNQNKLKQEKDVIIDTTVQEKNITFPTDDKLYKKIITKCKKIADKEDIQIRQTYSRTLKRLSYQQRFRKSKRHQALARKADKKIKTIAGRLVRELERKLSPSEISKYSTELELYKRVLRQKKDDKNKIYSLHEPHVKCISKGKAHKRYEFGSKAAITIGRKSGIIYGALNIEQNAYDGHTLPAVLEQFERINGYVPSRAIVDLGFRGVKKIDNTLIVTPQSSKGKTEYEKRKLKQDHRRRASIEGKISHIKYDCRLARNYYKGVIGDNINVLLSAAGSNFRRWMNLFKRKARYFLSKFITVLDSIFLFIVPDYKLGFIAKMTF